MSMVLVVDDKDMMRDGVVVTLERAGFEVASAPDGEAALAQVAQRRPDAIVTDMRMPNMTGIELLERVRQIDDEIPVILMTAFGTIETAVKAMKLGAFDYLTKPFEGDELIICVKRAAEHRRLVRENAVLRAGRTDQPPPDRRGGERLIGRSPALERVRAQLAAVAGSHGTVMVTGESGTGKEVVSRAIHEMSSRRAGPFLAVNCAALSESLLESELFGHERGAFTGADRTRKGRFELADGGTLLLDEVSEVSPKIQAKLLRVLQERAFERVGSSTSIGVDVRVIATSNRELPAEVEKGNFRSDLYFRLHVLPIHLPPLRERREDIAELAQHFVREICARDGRPQIVFSIEAVALLAEYQWPGNIRELQNICERAVVLSGLSGAPIQRDLLEPWLKLRATPMLPVTQMIESKLPPQDITSESTKTLEEIERETIVRTLEKFKGHRQRTATALGIGVRTLGLKLKKWKELKLVADTL
ncbi:MAG: sigma-54-dependent transcriptional regulator [Phycisphaerales bacterium]